jgi:hypothetical protein
MKQDSIFIGIAAYNEEDIIDTIDTAFSKAENPDNIYIGVVLHYPKKNFPDLSKYKNVDFVNVSEKIGLGVGMSRMLASTFYKEEDYYLQIDGHTVFKNNWDKTLKQNYVKLKTVYEKPIISSYVPYYYRDKNTGEKTTMVKDNNWEADYPSWSLVSKSHPEALGIENEEKYLSFAYGIEALDSPGAKTANYNELGYEEHYLISGHFLFTSGSFIKDVKYDPMLAYHEENAIALLAWTRGYKIFNIKDHVLWTRDVNSMGRDVPNSWKQTYLETDENGVSFRDKVVSGTLRNKEILTGKVLGEYGSPSIELIEEYEKASGLNYKKFYSEMYKVVEETGNKYPAGRMLYDLERSLNE